MNARPLPALALCALLGPGCTAPRAERQAEPAPAAPTAPAPPAPAAKGRHLPAPDYLPEAARQLLKNRMARHRENGALLMDAVVLLDYPGAEVAAVELLGEPQIARPSPGETDTLNANLPTRFFDLQAQFLGQARLVKEAAEARDAARLGQTWSGLAQLCVSCHAVYLGERPARP